MKRTILAMLAAAATLVGQGSSAPADDDGPGRGVARISLINGDVSMKRGDSGEVSSAAINAPMVLEDRLMTGAGSRAEVQFDYANMIRVAADSEIRMGELEQRRYIVQLAAGMVTFRVLRDSDADVEISTPSIAVRPLKKGEYRVAVKPDGTTEVTVRQGEADLYTPRGAEKLRSGKTMLARGTQSDPEFQAVGYQPEDEWDRWNERRDRDLDRSRSYQYVSRDIYGAEDLDAHGRWVNVAPYGMVWAPNASADWAPYRSGRWAWVDWYGWTWISYDPWGWAPYHYGRWFNTGAYWAWWPGGGWGSRHHWRPALVTFFGWNSYSGLDVGLGIGFGRIGWCPLGPYETYRPWYGRGYYGGYRGGGYGGVHVVNNVNITNVYRNSRVRGGVTAIDGADFSSGRVRNIRTVSRDDLARASHVQGQVPVAPNRESMRVSDREVRGRIESRTNNDRFYSRRQPTTVDRVSFDDQRRGIEQIARRSAGEPGRGGERGEGARTDGRVGQTDNADRGGWRRAGEPTRRSGEAEGARRSGEAPARRTESEGASRSTEGGWRRVGEPTRRNESEGARRSNEGATGTDRGGQVGEPTRRNEAEGARRSNEGATGIDRGGRVGEPTRRNESEGAGRANGGWRRFGDPARTSEQGARTEQAAPTRRSESENGGAWQKFGEPERGVSRSEGRVERSEQPGSISRSESRGGSPEPSGRTWGGGRSSDDSVRVSPPIVRERSRPAESGGRSSEAGGGARQSAPRVEGGGGRGGWSGGESRGGAGGGGGRSDGGESRGGGGGRSGGGEGRGAGGGGRQR